MAKEQMRCSFCGRLKPETNILIAGIDAHICDRCVEQAYNIVLEEENTNSKHDLSEELLLKKPIEIRAFLDQYVIGQDQTKKVMSVAVYNHYKRLLQEINGEEEDIEIEKTASRRSTWATDRRWPRRTRATTRRSPSPAATRPTTSTCRAGGVWWARWCTSR